MINDTNSSIPLDSNIHSNYVDSSVPNRQVVNITADEATIKVANNIEQIKAVANNLTILLSSISSFESKYNKINQERIYDGNKKTGLEVLDNSLILKNYLSSIDSLSQNITQIINISNIKDDITSLNLLINEIQVIADNIDSIKNTSVISDYIVNISGISTELVELKSKQDEFLALHSNLEQILTIFNYLPSLVKIHTVINRYLQLQQSLNFSDEQAFNTLKNINDNLEDILNVSNQLESIKDIVLKIEDLDNITDKVNTSLIEINNKYTLELNTLGKDLSNELQQSVLETKKQFQDLIERQFKYVEQCSNLVNSLTSIKHDIDLAKINFKDLEVKTESNLNKLIREQDAKYSELKEEYSVKLKEINNQYDSMVQEFNNRIITLENEIRNKLTKLDKYELEYSNIREQIELIIQSKISEMIKVDLSPFLVNNKIHRLEVLELIKENSSNTGGMTEEEIKKLVVDTITKQNLTKEEVIQWLQELNKYRDNKLSITNFEEFIRS